MPAHLTRLVIRRILSNEPIVYRDCLRRRANAFLRPHSQRIPRSSYTQTRSFFGFSREPARQVKDADFTPGLEKMMELNRSQAENSRPPQPLVLSSAFKDLISSKQDRREYLSDVEASHALNTFRHLRKTSLQLENGAEETPVMPGRSTLEVALSMLSARECQRSEAHLALAEEMFQYIEAKRAVNPKQPGAYSLPVAKNFIKLVGIMCFHGQPLRARDLLVEKYKTHGWEAQESVMSAPWHRILEALYKQENEVEAQRSLEIMQELGFLGYVMTTHLVRIHAERGDLERTKKYYEEAVNMQNKDGVLPGATYQATLKCCLQHKEYDWGQSVVRAMLEKLEWIYERDIPVKDLPKEMWDSLFLWAAASGKGVDEVDRMMNIMVRKSFPDGTSISPDINTFNRLIEWCMSQKQPYFAERYIALGLKWGVHPNADTYNLQIMYRLSGGDIDGARASYKLLLAEDCPKQEDVAAANKLIQAMCTSQKYNFNTIMALVEDLNERKARFEPETVSVLSLLHLQRNELHDVIDLLHTHAFHFSEEARLKIADKLVALILDRKHSSITRAWDTYIITHSIFTELLRETRTNIMREFFARGRADMACHVFAHMRELQHPNTKANADTYVAVLTGIAEFAMPRQVAPSPAAAAATDISNERALDADADAEDDREAECTSLLAAVHTAMKLDLDIDPSTRLRNALMLAYTACAQPARAWTFWEDIINSREGPSYNSIPIAFRACERMVVGGEEHAKALWARLRNMDVEVSKGMLAGYVGALAGNQCVEEAKEAVMGAEREFGWRADGFL